MSELHSERAADGKLFWWVFALADRNLLRRCSECLVGELGAQPTERFDAMDQVFLDFTLAGSPIVLQLTSGRGIAVSAGATAPPNEELVERVAKHLARRVTP